MSVQNMKYHLNFQLVCNPLPVVKISLFGKCYLLQHTFMESKKTHRTYASMGSLKKVMKVVTNVEFFTVLSVHFVKSLKKKAF